MVRGTALLVISLIILLMAGSMNGMLLGSTDACSESTVEGTRAAMGWINGTVKDKVNGKPIEGCFVGVVDSTTNTLTNKTGFYSLQVNSGVQYEVKASKAKYHNQSSTSAKVEANKGTTLDFLLVKSVATLYISFSGEGLIGSNSGGDITIINHTDKKYYENFKMLRNPETYWQFDVPAPATYDIFGYVINLKGTVNRTISVTSGQFLVVYLNVNDIQKQTAKVIISTKFENGTAASGVDLSIVYIKGGVKTEYQRVTNAYGVYEHEYQEPGAFNITISKAGYVKETKSIESTQLTDLTVNFTLRKEITTDDNENTIVIVIIVVVIALVALIGASVAIVLVRKRMKGREIDEDEYVCPKCGLVVDEKAVKCPKCKFKFPWKQFRCPECGKLLDFNAKKCKGCGNTEFEMK